MEQKTTKIQRFTDLKAWQEGHKLVIFVYKLTKKFPREEMYSLIDQMRRAASSVTSNIAEGFGRQGYKEKACFYRIAAGSLTELENQVLISKDVGYLNQTDFDAVMFQADLAHKLLAGLISKTKSFIHSNPSFFILFSIFYFLFSFSPVNAATIGAPANFLTMNSGLVGWWTFDNKDLINNVADKSGLGNNGRMLGAGATSSAVIAGKLGQALKFNGASSYVSVADSSSLNLSAGNFTIGLWVMQKPGGPSGSNAQGLLDFGYQCNEGGRELVLKISSSNSISATISYDGTSGNTTNIGPVSMLRYNQWVYVTLKSDASNLYLYSNGVLAATQPKIQPSFYNSGASISIGRTYCGSTESFMGQIDDARVYNRALSAQEVKQLYNNGVGAKLSASEPVGNSFGLANGLVGYWSFDSKDLINNVTDRSGLGNNGALQFGTLGNKATSSMTVAGKLGQGLKFDGVDDYVEVADNAAIRFGKSDNFTVSAWAKIITPVANSGIVWKRIGNPGYGLFYNGSFVFFISNKPTGVNWVTYGLNTPQLNVWYHLTGTYTSNRVMKFYINGVYQGTETISDIDFVNSDNLRMGRRVLAEEYFNGLIDDVRIYNRALSAQEVKQLYNNGAGAKLSASQPTGSSLGLANGLIGYWTFDSKDLINNVADRSGNGNPGALKLGTLGNKATSSMTVAGRLGQALKFDGADDYVNAGNISTYNLANTNHSFSLWFKIATMPAINATRLLDRFTGGTPGSGYLLFINNTNGLLYYQDEADGVNTEIFLSSQTSVVNNKWHNVVITVDTAAQMGYMYIDGVQKNSDAYSGNLRDYNRSLYVGGRSTDLFFPGLLDDIRIYNRALSAAEVKQLYNMGK